ncbi:MAG: hypothetical protein U1D06_01310 [Paracoccaceae bacterium]|nr:hypothetical protein [Paracoccaceae bacterium]
MELALFLIGIPLVCFLSLAMLPRGRMAFVGIATAAAALAVVWLTSARGGDAYLVVLCGLVAAAIGLAMVTQALRLALPPDRPGWFYPSIVVVALLGAGVPMLLKIGV